MKTSRPSMAYPFVTRRQVLERLDRDPEFVRECIAMLHRRFIDRDVLPPPAGWMSSHRKLGEQTYGRLIAPDVTASDIATAATLAKRYSAQVTKCLREEQLAREPGLAVAAAVFGVRGADEMPDPWDADPYPGDDERQDDAIEDADATTPAEAAAVATAEETETTGSPLLPSAPSPDAGPADAPPVRRRGRPKGSRNRPKSESAAKPKKRRRRS